MFDKVTAKDEILLIARVLMMVLFVLCGWQRLSGFDATVISFAGLGLPLPMLAACCPVGAEFGFGVAIAVGFLTRPIAVSLAIYTVVISFIGHPYWTMSGAAEAEAEISFFKNISIAGGLLLLYLTGGGKYSLDEMIGGDGSSA